MSRTLANRAAVITGASAGIGRAIALDLAVSGANVVINARRKDRLEELAREIEPLGARAAIVAGDAASPDVITQMLDAAPEHFGAEADIVVANAGRGLAGSTLTSDDDQWEEMLRVNVLACARLMRAAAKRMLEQCPEDKPLAKPRDLVVLGSNVGRHISPFSSMYGSTKFAVNSLAEATRRELAPRGVRVSLIEPGIVKSEFQEVAGYDDEWTASFMQKFGPVLEPEDVARLVTFIISQPAHVHINNALIRPTRQDYP